jgi:DNA polymerase III, delta subunit
VTPEQVRAELAGDLPPATLVLGPGAWAVVDGPSGLRADNHHQRLDAALTRDICAAAAWAPRHGRQVFALCLDGASTQVQNMLLKVLEEPPPGTRFVLAAEARPLDTVVSRCRVLVLGAESAEDLVDPKDKAAVTAVLRAARSGQSALLTQNLRGWQPVHARLLSVWSAEAVSGRWEVFGPDSVPGVSSSQAMRLLTELSLFPGARLGPMAALSAVFQVE